MIGDIVAKTDGVPLFLEEVTKNVLHSDRQDKQAGRDAVAARLEIPATLRDSLTARLDELSGAKKIAQIGAVIGRQFRHDLVRDLCDMPADELTEALAALVASGLVWQREEQGNNTYTFKHALIQDAAYESLLKSDRKLFHRRAAEGMLLHFPEMSDSEPEVLARHYSAGDVPEKAAQLWLRAGQKAWQRSTATEAIAHLNSGLESVKRVGDPQSREALELRLQSALGVVYFAAVSYAAPQAQAAFMRAYELCERVPEVELKAPVLYGIGAFQTMKGDMRAGHAAFEKLIAEAKSSQQPRLLLYTHSALTWSNYNRGHYATAIEHRARRAPCTRPVPLPVRACRLPIPKSSASASAPPLRGRSDLPIRRGRRANRSCVTRASSMSPTALRTRSISPACWYPICAASMHSSWSVPTKAPSSRAIWAIRSWRCSAPCGKRGRSASAAIPPRRWRCSTMRWKSARHSACSTTTSAPSDLRRNQPGFLHRVPRAASIALRRRGVRDQLSTPVDLGGEAVVLY